MNNLKGDAALNLTIKSVLFTICSTSVFQYAWADAALLPESVIVVTSSQRPILNADTVLVSAKGSQLDIQFLNLDSVTDIEKRLGDGLPIDPEQARATVDQRIARIGRSQLDADLRAAYLPLGTMMAYGLDRYPVIIFDQQAVIYGVTDVAQAVDQYRQWREDQQGVAVHE
jgi:integrating conjugative element protein (TIGR03757 family)